MKKQYSAKDIIEMLEECGFKYTVHGLRKQVDLGCVPSFKLEANKKKYFSNTDFKFIKSTAILRAISNLTIFEIQLFNRYIWDRDFKNKEMCPADTIAFNILSMRILKMKNKRLKAFNDEFKHYE